MRSRSRWKQVERDWAEALGGKRVPVTGRARGSAPDVEHPVFSVEVKAGAVVSERFRDGMEQAIANATLTGRIPLLCISNTRKAQGKGTKGSIGRPPAEHYVVMRKEDFMQVLKSTPVLNGDN